MLNPQHESPPRGTMAAAPIAERLYSIKARVRAAFDIMASATITVPRMDPALSARMRGPLGRLVAAGQMRDMFDQRIAHVETAYQQASALDPTQRSAVLHVTALQLVELSRMVEETAREAAAAFRGLGDLAEEAGPAGPAPDVRTTLSVIAREGLSAAAELTAASDILGVEADGHAAGIERGVTGAQIAAVDLGWVLALYTMDAERRVHRMAIAQAASGR